MIGRGVAAPHIGQAHSRTRELDPHAHYTSIDAVPAKDVPLGSHRYVSSRGGVIPEKPFIWGRQWGFPA
jgi:hypothetical protein